MENETSDLKKLATTYGFLLGITSILLVVIGYVLNMQKNWVFSLIGFISIIAFIILPVKKFKTDNNGFLTLSQALKIGLAVAVIGGIIYAVYSYIHYSYIQPDFIDQIMEEAAINIEKTNPDMPEDQKAVALEWTKKMSTPGVLSTFAIIGNLFLGFIVSLIGGLIMQKKQDLY